MQNTTNHRTRNTIIGVIALLAVAAFLIVMQLRSRVTLYDDPNTVGNTSGNLLNGGRFCESDEKIYFSNPYDENTLYSMDSKLEHVKQISSDQVSYLNVAGKYIFYTRRNDKKSSTGEGLLSLSTTGLFRINTDGKHMGKLYDDPTQVVNLYGNYVYYQHYDQKQGLQLYAAKIDSTSDDMLVDEGVAPYSVDNGLIYYTGYDSEHAIHSMNINGSDKKTLLEGNYTSLIKQGEHLFYLDMDQDYALCRANLDGSESEILISDRIATYNINTEENIIYYQIDDGENNGLYQMDLSSGKSRLIALGDYNYLHLTSEYLFYESFDGSTAYVMDLATEEPRTFQPKVKVKK